MARFGRFMDALWTLYEHRGLQQRVDDLLVQLEQASTLRTKVSSMAAEVAEWRHRHSGAASMLQESHARFAADVARLSARMQGYEDQQLASEAARAAATVEQALLEERLSRLAELHRTCTGNMDQA